MIIKVLGSGCKSCRALEQQLHSALEELDVAAEVLKISKMDEIIQYDVMMTPALVINGKIKAAGHVPKLEELKQLIREEM
jgi:small redox-active disulfide protein 2